jgi:hypothetical protein
MAHLGAAGTTRRTSGRVLRYGEHGARRAYRHVESKPVLGGPPGARPLTAFRGTNVRTRRKEAYERGIAWSERLGRLVNQWAADHAHGLPAASPILAIDMYEHAYHQDFGAKAAAYVDQVMADLNWKRIGMRYRWTIGEGKGEDELFLPYGAPPRSACRSGGPGGRRERDTHRR